MTRIFLSAGEVSGDMHGAHLARALRRQLPDVRLDGIGSTQMAEAGVAILEDVTAHSAVGLTENLPHVWPVMRAFQRAKRQLRAHPPDALVLIDFQGANLALAKFARTLGIPTIYYIAPQEWLWGFKRGAREVARNVDLLLAIFPQEAETYADAGAQVAYVGHPLIDILEDAPAVAPGALGLDASRPIVALLPGSRRQEVRDLTVRFVGAASRLASRYPEAQFVLPVASAALEAPIREAVAASGVPITVVAGRSQTILRIAHLAIAASGTATLESAILGVPCVAAYRVSAVTAFLAKRLLRVAHVTLPNIVARREVIPELLQSDATPEALAEAAARVWGDGPGRAAQLAGLAEVRERLGGAGAIARAASAILKSARATTPVAPAPVG